MLSCTLFAELQPLSSNGGDLDLGSLLANPTKPQALYIDNTNQAGSNERGTGFQLFRVGDAVACRNIHASIYDSLRLCKDI
jgi:hypothetical protein